MIDLEFWSICRAVAKYCGYKVKPNKWLYLDPYGCDLVIEFFSESEDSAHINVSMGGVSYYEYHRYDNGLHPLEICRNKGTTWKDLIDEIWCANGEIIGQVNHTLIEVCKREAEENRETTKRIVDRCTDITRRLGYNAHSYERVYTTEYGDEYLEISYEVRDKDPTDPDVTIWVFIKPSMNSEKKKCVYLYTYNEKPKLGECNVHRYKPGPWELTLASLAR